MDSDAPPRRPDEHVAVLPGWWTTVQQAEQQALQLTRGTDVVTAATHVVDGIALVTAQVAGPHLVPVAGRDRRLQVEHRVGLRLGVGEAGQRR